MTAIGLIQSSLSLLAADGAEWLAESTRRPTVFQWVFAPICVALAVVSLWRMQRGRLARRQGLFWAFIWLCGAGLILVPGVTSRVAGWLGIGRGTDLILYLSLLVGVWAFGYLYIRMRSMGVTVTEMVRRDALRNAEHGGSPPVPERQEERP